MQKKKTKEVITTTSSNDYTEILFGEKPTKDSFYNGYWHPTYCYEKLLENVPFYPVLKVVHPNDKITDIDIIFRSKNPKNKKNTEVKKYNWANPYFWIENGFYPKLKHSRINDEIFSSIPKNPSDPVDWPPIDEDFEIILGDIWQICVTKTGIASMPRITFYCLIYLIRVLIENTIVFSIKEIDNYKLWKRHVYNYLEETHYLFDTIEKSKKLLKGWQITEKSSPEKMQNSLVSDIKMILNQFYENIKPDNGLGIFLNKIYRSYGNELVNQGLFIKCAHCGHLAEYLKNKKYCSYTADGKNCGKSARNRRYYSVKGKARLSKYRQTTKELRALYKEKGIKK